jgi:hypothetical protein
MSIVETVLVFAGIPIGAFAVVAAVTLGPGAARSPRYRPGGPWDYRPVWYLPHPAHPGPASNLAGAAQAALGARAVSEPAEPTGGASGEW